MSDLRKMLDQAMETAHTAVPVQAFRRPEALPSIEIALPAPVIHPHSFAALLSAPGTAVQSAGIDHSGITPASLPTVTSELPRRAPDPPPERYFAAATRRLPRSKEQS